MKNILVTNFSVKLFSLILAIGIWLHVATEKKHVTQIKVPIVLMTIPANLLTSNTYPVTAEVQIEATGKELLTIYFDEKRLEVDCRQAKLGNQIIKIETNQLKLASGIVPKVLAIHYPKQLVLEFDVLYSKKIPVSSSIQVDPAENHIWLKPILFEPPLVEAIGPRRIVSQIESVYSESLVLQDLQEDDLFNVKLDSRNYINTRFSPSIVRAKVDIQKRTSREIQDIFVVLINIPENSSAHLDTNRVTLLVSGGVEIVNNLKKEDINVYVDYQNFTTKGKEEVPPKIVVFKEVEWTIISPKVFRLIEGEDSLKHAGPWN